MGRPIQPVSLVQASNPSYFALIDTVTPAQNLQHVTLFNGSADKRVLVHRIAPINLTLTAVTGVGLRFNMMRATAASAGTLATIQKHDSADADVTSGIVVRTGATVTEGGIILPLIMNNDENGLTDAASNASFETQGFHLPSAPDARKLTLRPGEGLTVKQITNSVVGSFAWLVVFSTANNL
jgi:hypothetical protein